VADELEVVSVSVVYECSVVVLVIARSHPGRTVVDPSGFQGCLVEFIDRATGGYAKCYVSRLNRGVLANERQNGIVLVAEAHRNFSKVSIYR